MSFDALDAAHTSYVRLTRAPELAPTELIISRAALHLHTFGVLSSIEAGRPGFVSDSYLSAITAETSVTALELCLAGLWERVDSDAGDGGYRVSDADTLSVAEQIHGQLHDLARRCVREGGHVVDPHDTSTCARCGTTVTASG